MTATQGDIGAWDDARMPRPESTDAALLIFVLSALSPSRAEVAVRNVAAAVRPGGEVFIRDYARGDRAEERLAHHADYCSQLGPGWFLRPDGTFATYMTLGFLRRIVSECALTEECAKIVERTVGNRKQAREMERRFVQMSLRKPHLPS